MKKILIALALLVFGWAGAPGLAHAETHWVNYGADKAYTSRAAAIADAPRVHRQAGLPEPVVALFQEAMKHPGKRVIISNGMKLDYMRTGPTGLWRDVVVAFKQTIARMLITAPAEEWSVTYNGVTYSTGIPDICYNLYGMHVQAPPAPAPCGQIRVNTKSADVTTPESSTLHFIMLGERMPSDPNCPFLYKGPHDAMFYPLPTECPHGPCDFKDVIQASGLRAGPSGGIDVSRDSGTYTFQVSEAWMKSKRHLYVFCLSRVDGTQSCGKDIGAADYFDRIAIVGYAAADAIAGWAGKLRIWCFVKRPELCGQCH